MAVDNEAVRKIICEKLGFSTGDSLGARIGEAFDMVTLEREGRGKGDVNYATAEHYMFARYVICWTGYAGLPFMVGGISAYLGLKLLFPNLSRLAKTGSGPVTPVSIADLDWQKRGCSDGLTDFGLSPMSSPSNVRFPSQQASLG